MADQNIQLDIKVNAETGKLEVLGAKFDDLSHKSNQTKTAFQGLSGEATSLLKSVLPFATAGGIVSFFSSAVKGAEEQNEAFRRLEFVLKSTGEEWGKNKQIISEWSKAVQESTRFSDGQALETLDKLTRATGNLKQAQSASILAMNLSVVSGKSLAETTELVNGLVTGQERAVKMANKEFGAFAGGAKTAQEAIDNLSRSTADHAIKEESLTKSAAQSKNAFSEFSQQIGQTIIPAVEWFVSKLTVLLKVIDSVAQVLATTFAEVFHGVEGLMRMIHAVVTGNFSDIKEIGKETLDNITNDVKESAQKVIGTWVGADRAIAKIVQQSGQEPLKVSATVTAQLIKDRAKVTAEHIKEEMKRLHAVNEATARIKKIHDDEKFDTLSAATETFAILNSLGDQHTQGELARARIILAIEKSIAIARILSQPGPLPLKMAEVGLVVAQFAQQSKALGQAQQDFNSQHTSTGIETAIDDGTGRTVTVGTGGGFGGGSGGGGGGGGAGTVINLGGIVLNLSFESLSMDNVRPLAVRLTEMVRQSVTEGVQLAKQIKITGDKNAGVAP